MLTYREAQKTDFAMLIGALRSEDLVEATLATGKPVEETLNRRVLEVPGAMTFSLLGPDGDLLAMFGSFPSPCCEGEGVAWMLCTDIVSKYRREIYRTFPEQLDRISEPYTALTAHMWAGNTMHAKWADAMGLFHEPEGDTYINQNRFLKIYRPTR